MKSSVEKLLGMIINTLAPDCSFLLQESFFVGLDVNGVVGELPLVETDGGPVHVPSPFAIQRIRTETRLRTECKKGARSGWGRHAHSSKLQII